MWWKEMKGEGKIRGGEDGESFDEDVGYRFVFGEVGVELIAAKS